MESLAVIWPAVTGILGVGFVIGTFTSRFMSKKECEFKNSQIWKKYDEIMNLLAGGKIKCELRIITPGDED